MALEGMQTHTHTHTHIKDALLKLACLQQYNHNSVVGFYEWEWAIFFFFSFRCRADNASSLTCFPAHTHMADKHITHTHIPAHINIEKLDVGVSRGENL